MRIRVFAGVVCILALAACGDDGGGGGDGDGGPAQPAGPQPKVLVLGDSIAQGYARGLDRDGRFEVVNAATVNCTINGGLLQGYRGTPVGQACDNWRVEWPALVQQHQPDIVLVLTGGWEIVNRWFDRSGVGRAATINDDEFQQGFLAAIDEATTLLSAGGAEVVYTTSWYINPPEPLPTPAENPEINEIWYEPYGPTDPPANWEPPVPDQEFVSSKDKIDRLNELKLEFGQRGTATVIDVNAFVSPDGEYTDEIDGVYVRHEDLSHFNEPGYDIIADFLAPTLLDLARSREPTTST